MFNQCPICYSETTLVYEMNGQNVCPSCFISKYDFDESLHPRDEDGKFEDKAGGGSKPKRGHLDKHEFGPSDVGEDVLLDRNATILGKDLKMNRRIAVDTAEAIRAFSGNGYVSIRDSQNNLRRSTEKVSKQAKLIEDFIQKSPSYDGEIYRGTGIFKEQYDSFGGFKEGQIIDMKGTSSWSSDIDVANDFANKGSKSDKIQIIFKSNNVKKSTSINHLSRLDEKEVLVSKDAKFKINSIQTNVNGVTTVEVEEQNG